MDQVSNGTGIPRQEVVAVVDGFLASVIDAVADGQRVELRRFGTWKPVLRKGRMLKIPNGKKTVAVPDHRSVVFLAAQDFKDRMGE